MSYGCNIKLPIFMTPKEREEYNKIENKKKSEIVAEIKKNVAEMPDNDLASAFQKDCAKGERLKHHELVSLYCEVKESLTLQNALTSVEPTDGEVIFESDD